MSGMKPRAPRKAPRVFTVQWDDARQRYITTDDKGDLYGSDRDLNSAVGSAVRGELGESIRRPSVGKGAGQGREAPN